MTIKLQTSYEKVALSLAVLIALGLGAMICASAGRVERDFQTAHPTHHAVPEMAIDWGQPGPLDGGAANIFTGQPEHVVKGREGTVDLTDPSSAPIHPPIPNTWWLKHGIDPSFADSSQRDPDKDGFSNLEEFRGGAHPNDFKSHPPLHDKLRLATLEWKTFAVTFTTHSCDGAPVATDKYGFRYADTEKRRNNQAGIPAGQGAASTFFAKAPGQLRLELKAVRLDRVRDQRVKNVRDVYTATLIDRGANKDGREYEVQKGSDHALKVRDYTATLVLDAIGLGTNQFAVQENESFALPHQETAKKKPYRFKEVRNGARGLEVIIEFTDCGQKEDMILTGR